MVYSTIDKIFQPFQETDLRVLCSSHKLIYNAKASVIIWFNQFLLRQQEDEPYWVWYHCLTILLSFSLLKIPSGTAWKKQQNNSNESLFRALLVISHRDWTIKSAVLYFLKENISSISLVSIFLLLTVLIKLSLLGVVIWGSLLTWSDQREYSSLPP